jgi:hypothetical protein
MTWTPGRQNYFYHKLKIYSFWKIDCYLIRYSKGLAIGYHVDDVPGHKHYRLNIQLRGINRLCLLEDLNRKMGRFTWFRSDRMHSFGITLEPGLILSFGFAIKERE